MNETTDVKETPKTLELKTKEYVGWGIYSFADYETAKAARESAEEIREASDVFMQLVYNITSADPAQVPNKKKALLSLMGEFGKIIADPTDDTMKKEVTTETGFVRSDYLINFSDSPENWKYLVVKESGKVDFDLLSLAVDLMKKEFLPTVGSDETIQAIGRVTELCQGLGVDADQFLTDGVSVPPVFLWKEANKPMRFMLIYSNNALDSDPVEPNLFKAMSHKAFADLANEGFLPMPEAWALS